MITIIANCIVIIDLFDLWLHYILSYLPIHAIKVQTVSYQKYCFNHYLVLIKQILFNQNSVAGFLSNVWYRFSAFWLRSKCSICSYQLNIWYESHRLSSILNWFLDGDRVSAACCGSITCWPCIAVPQGSAHFPTKYINSKINIHAFQWR